jgi:SAGA-associated factor 29
MFGDFTKFFFFQVLFEDPSYADGYSPPLNVAQRYIIQVTEKKKGK